MQHEPHTFGKKSKRRILLGVAIAVAILFISAAIGFFLSMTTARVVDEQGVRDELITQNTRVKGAMVDDMLTPASVDQVASTKTVVVHLKKSSDAKTYCIEAYARDDAEAVRFHMFKGTPATEPIAGLCGDNAEGAPRVPEKFTIGAAGVSTASFSWEEIPDAKEYTLQCALSDAYTSPKQVTVVRSSGKIEELVANTSYLCRVAAVNSAGTSAWSNSVSVRTGTQLLAPKELKVSAVSSTSLSYSWQAVPGATRYILEYATDAAFSENVKQEIVSKTQGTLTGLIADKGYYVHVKAITPTVSESQAPFSAIVQGRTPQ